LPRLAGRMKRVKAAGVRAFELWSMDAKPAGVTGKAVARLRNLSRLYLSRLPGPCGNIAKNRSPAQFT